jgi:hypothetical protein
MEKVLQLLGVSKAITTYLPTLAVRRHGGTVCHNGREAPAKNCRFAQEGLGREVFHLSSYLQGINSRHYGLDPRELCLPYDLLVGALPTRSDPLSTTQQIS